MIFTTEPIKERRKFTMTWGESTVGRTIVYITCPYCGTVSRCYAWSVAGCGKRCQCGAKHIWSSQTTEPKQVKLRGKTKHFVMIDDFWPEKGVK